MPTVTTATAVGSGLLSANVGSAVANLLIFLCVFAILAKFVWPSILQGLQAREEAIRGDLEGAEKANAEAQALLAKYQTQLSEAQHQVQSMLSEAKKDAEKARETILREAKEEADRKVARAVEEIQVAKSAALSEVAESTSGIALSLAKQVVGRELKAADHADLIKRSLDQFPSNN